MLKKVQLERVTQPIRKEDTQPLMIVTGDMPVTWNTPRPLPLVDEEVTERRIIVTPDDWLVLKAQEVPCGEDEWIR